jgi:peptide-methionine (S)-S-oxide reductase
VTKVTSGYAGGDLPNPTYYGVASGRSGHAEVVKVEFDPAIITLEDILDIFWAIHDPTTVNRQGHDVGPEYRSIILYETDKQKPVVEASVQAAAKLWADPIVTEIKKLAVFYEAEPEQQNFFKTHPEAAYCQVVINPKLIKLRQKFAKNLA